MMSGHVDPDRERYAIFKELPRDQKIHMLNLVRLRETAVYEDGMMLTGHEAYAAYSRESGPVFKRLGGRIVWSGKFDMVLIGPESEYWDICFIAEYPDAEAFMAMLRDDDYRNAVKHRQAAVIDSRLIRCTVNPTGGMFG
jgi:uncharacterized protein (DUF1330 family)